MDSSIPLMCPLMTSILCVWQRLPLKPASLLLSPLRKAARQADMVLLAVKPNVVESVVAEMGDALCGKAVLSIASGWTTEKLRALLPESARVMFVIPNTPCMVGEGMAIAEEGSTFTQEEQDYVRELFSAIGQYRVVPQKLMNGASTLTGCGRPSSTSSWRVWQTVLSIMACPVSWL